ncbi:MAG: hypothetical protein RIC95_10930 [Vicingaceae bacterium]
MKAIIICVTFLLSTLLAAQEAAYKLNLKEVSIEEVKKRDLVEVGYLNKGFIAQNVISLDHYTKELATWLKFDFQDTMLMRTVKVKLFADSLPFKVRLKLIMANDSGFPKALMASQVFEITKALKRNTLEWDIRHFNFFYPVNGVIVSVSDAKDKNEKNYKTFGLLCTTLLDSNIMIEKVVNGGWNKAKKHLTISGKNANWWNGKVNLILLEE